jgi:hypothetical protein
MRRSTHVCAGKLFYDLPATNPAVQTSLLRKINFFPYAGVFFGKAGFCQIICKILHGNAPKSDVVHLTLYRKMGYNQVRDVIGDRGASILRSACIDDSGDVSTVMRYSK